MLDMRALQDVLFCLSRSRFEVSEGRILELEEQADQLQATAATAEAAVQEHLLKREQQTERIKKAKGAGPKSELLLHLVSCSSQ